MNETRKIAAILAADVVGYGRLAGADEDRTLARLRALRSDLIDPTIAVHHGRIVKRTGDGLIVEFRSVVDAVRCAIEVQNGMVERNAGLPPERRIEFRVGIHLGDVVEETDGDLMGDGVNIAARLEGIVAPTKVAFAHNRNSDVRDPKEPIGASQLPTPASSSKASTPQPERIEPLGQLAQESVELRFRFKADAGYVWQADITASNRNAVRKAAERLEDVRVGFVAAQMQAGRDVERHLMTAVRNHAPRSPAELFRLLEHPHIFDETVGECAVELQVIAIRPHARVAQEVACVLMGEEVFTRRHGPIVALGQFRLQRVVERVARLLVPE